MSTSPKRPTDSGPRGPEGVPLDAPGNEAPALSPHAPSRMHRAEDDAEAAANSPDFSDSGAVAHDRGNIAPESSATTANADRDTTDHALDQPAPERRDPNPSHHTRKRPGDPDGLGEGELMEQPDSTGEAREPGPDSPPDEKRNL